MTSAGNHQACTSAANPAASGAEGTRTPGLSVANAEVVQLHFPAFSSIPPRPDGKTKVRTAKDPGQVSEHILRCRQACLDSVDVRDIDREMDLRDDESEEVQ